MRKKTILACVSVLALLAVAVSVNATPKKRFDEGTQTCRVLTFYNSGWVSEGSEIFDNNCKSCHSRDGEKAPFLYTESKTMKGWNRVFHTRYPQCARAGHWDSLTQQDLLKLNDYLFRNAANTYDPNDADDCG